MDAALSLFLERTQRLTLSPYEFSDALSWGWDRVPPRVLEQAMARTLDSRKPEQLPGKRLGWVRWQVQDELDAWRRAIGPQ